MEIKNFKYKYHDVIAETCKSIIEDVFAEDELAEEIEYEAIEQLALDAHLLNIYAYWETEELRASLSFVLDTGIDCLQIDDNGAGNFSLKTTKDAEFSDVSISKFILDKKGNELEEYEWDVDNKKWDLGSSEDEMDVKDLKLAIDFDKDEPIPWDQAKKGIS